MKKKFGEKLDLDSYSTDQLNKTFKLIENKMAGYKNSKFNDTLKSEEYHRLTFMRDAVKTAISERVMTKEQESKMQQVDMKGKKCTSCKKGTYQETSQMDDMDGVVHCTKCGKGLKRHQKAQAKTNEGVEFSGALAKAKATHQDKFEVDGKEYPVKEGREVNPINDSLALMRKLAGLR